MYDMKIGAEIYELREWGAPIGRQAEGMRRGNG